jgi:DNA polymerase V
MLRKSDVSKILPLYLSPVAAGFPSPASDYIETKLDLNDYLVKHPAATFFVRVSGNSMKKAGIFNEDILIVDKSLTPQQNSIIVAQINGEFTVKRYRKEKGKIILYPENEQYSPMPITEGMEFEVWGVVTNVIHRV